MNKEKYNGWLVSNSFIKRMFAVFGYSIAAQLFIFSIIFGSLLLIAFIVSLIS